MTQVYSFVDENGTTRLFAEIHPEPAGTPFNGGTITGAITVAPTVAGTELTITAPAGQVQEGIIYNGPPANGGQFFVRANGDIEIDAFGETQMIRAFDDGGSFIAGSAGGIGGSGMNAAPATAGLSDGEYRLWFDKTNGAAKLMVIAKQADGTVRTGAIALT